MEKQLLPSPELKGEHGRLVWFWNWQDFSADDADRAAARVALRFGVTSWPQHILVDPATFEVLADTGRSVASFRAAAAAARVPGPDAAVAPAELKRADALAAMLQDHPDTDRAQKSLDDPDVVVRSLAIQILAKKAPERLVGKTGKLLETAHDPIRFAVCAVLAGSPDPGAREALEALLRDPKGSRNPNVLRCQASRAIATCGDARSLPALAAPAQAADPFNGLTNDAIDAILAIANRFPKAKPEAVKVLRESYPAPTDPARGEQGRRLCDLLARKVHAALGTLTGKSVPFPGTWDAAARARLARAW